MGGARIRTIKPETWDDEVFGRLSSLARLTFYGLISLADDEGRGRAGAAFLKSRLHPHAESVSVTDVARALADLAGTKRVVFYEIEGENFYQLKNFQRHQVINKPTKSTFPKPPSGSTTTPLREDYGSTTDGSEGSEGSDPTGREGSDPSLRGAAPSDGSATATPPTAPGNGNTKSSELSLDEINYRRKLAGLEPWSPAEHDRRTTHGDTP